MQVMFCRPSICLPSRVTGHRRNHVRFRRGRVRRLRLRRIHDRPSGALPARPDGHPDHEREQQLLDGERRARPRRRRALALGFERMAPGAVAINTAFPDRPSPMRPLLAAAVCASPDSKRGPLVPCVFVAAAAEYFKKYGGGVEHLAKIGEFCVSCCLFFARCVTRGVHLAAKNHNHSVNNPYAQVQAGYDEVAVLASPQISNELTKYMCSPTSVAYNIPLSSLVC